MHRIFKTYREALRFTFTLQEQGRQWQLQRTSPNGFIVFHNKPQAARPPRKENKR